LEHQPGQPAEGGVPTALEYQCTIKLKEDFCLMRYQACRILLTIRLVLLSARAFCSEITAQAAAGSQPIRVIWRIRQTNPEINFPRSKNEIHGNKIAISVIADTLNKDKNCAVFKSFFMQTAARSDEWLLKLYLSFRIPLTADLSIKKIE